MTTVLDVANRALQLMGSRTNMSSTEFANQTSNEAIQAQLIMFQLRDELNRMAPWDCATKWAPLVYISTIPGNPENPQAGLSLWQAGLPAIPWTYEYQYPVDCLRARMIIPQYTTQAGGVPIYPAGTVTGAGQAGWTGPALKFQVATDKFFGVISAVPSTGGSGYALGDIITLVQPTYTITQNIAPVGQPPIFSSTTMNAGAPVQLLVTGISIMGSISEVSVVSVLNQIQDEPIPIGGSYFSIPTNPVAQQSSSGIGVGANFTLTFSPQALQRVILCNQAQAILCYNTQVLDPNVMDPLFQDAWIHILAARLTFQLAGDKALANQQIQLANNMIMEARKADGNEGITVNDVTPDFIRTRGGYGVGPNFEYSPNLSFDWGAGYSPY